MATLRRSLFRPLLGSGFVFNYIYHKTLFPHTFVFLIDKIMQVYIFRSFCLFSFLSVSSTVSSYSIIYDFALLFHSYKPTLLVLLLILLHYLFLDYLLHYHIFDFFLFFTICTLFFSFLLLLLLLFFFFFFFFGLFLSLFFLLYNR